MSDEVEGAGPEERGSQFKPGQSGNPSGRPKGSRNKLGEAFVEALHNDFADHGVAAIRKAREEDPVAYVKVVAGLLPKEIKVDDMRTMTDEQLDNALRDCAALLGLELVPGKEQPRTGHP